MTELNPLSIAMLTVACLPGEPSGDMLGSFPSSDPRQPAHLLVVIDGLGHGPQAAIAAQTALELIDRHRAQTPEALFALLDPALQGTRGAALGVAWVEPSRITYAAVGNTRALRWRDGRATRLPSQYGIVGDGRPKRIDCIELDLRPGDWLALFSDGLDERLHLDPLPNGVPDDPRHLCARTLDAWRAGADDAALLVAVLG